LSVATKKTAVTAAPATSDLSSPAAWASEQLRELIASVPDYVLVLDRRLRVLLANRGVGRRSAKDLEGVPVTEFLPHDLHSQALAAMHRVIATGQVDGYSATLDDGESRHFDIRISPIRSQQQIVAITMLASETTEQVRAERAIATQACRIESMLEGVAGVSEQAVVEITNPAFDTMFGYRRGDLIGRPMTTLAGWPFEQPERWQQLASDPQGQGSMRVEFDGLRSDGTHFAAAGLLSRFDVAGRSHCLVVLQDVSERKQLERAILQAVNREQYRIGNDLHDGLGQELTGIALMLRGVAGRLASEYAPILPEIESITRLVNNAIESTRALARGLSPVNLERGGLSDALDGLAMHAAELYNVQIVCTHRVKTIRPLSAELANHLYRIAQEAVRNAVRHGRARTIRLHLHGARAKVRLTVTDDGTGMPVDAVDAAGMGLKIMQYRARILGGEVRFERAEPQGTRIVCECPLEPLAQPARAPRARRRSRLSTAAT